VREGLGSKCSLVIQYASTFISGIVVGIITSWKLTLVVMTVGPFFIGTSAYLAKVCCQTSDFRHVLYGVVPINISMAC